MIALLLATLAFGGDVCPNSTWNTPKSTVAVAWVSPVGKQAGAGAWLEVVPASQLRAWLTTTQRPTVGSMLRTLGLRNKLKEPRGRYKVTIFEVEAEHLCRPVEGAEESSAQGGLPACAKGVTRSTVGANTCAKTLDATGGKGGLDVYRVQWRDAARRGFCVLPGERFIKQGAKQ